MEQRAQPLSPHIAVTLDFPSSLVLHLPSPTKAMPIELRASALYLPCDPAPPPVSSQAEDTNVLDIWEPIPPPSAFRSPQPVHEIPTRFIFKIHLHLLWTSSSTLGFLLSPEVPLPLHGTLRNSSKESQDHRVIWSSDCGAGHAWFQSSICCLLALCL